MPKTKLNTVLFIEKARQVHGDLYLYGSVDYTGYHKKIIIECVLHGKFKQSPSKHLFGNGCPKCAKNRKLNFELFTEKASKVHNNFYDYSKVTFVKSTNKVIIVCPLHGDFLQECNSHLQGKSCPKCGTIRQGEKRRNSVEYFLELSKKTHGEKYDYSKVNYVNNKTPVEIVCKVHGIFKQRPDTHIHKAEGCWKCGGTFPLSLTEFIKRATETHGGVYDYSSVSFDSVLDYIDIFCMSHGIFVQNVKAHLDGNGCPRCKSSKLEKKVLKKLKHKLSQIPIIQYYKSDWLGKQHIDIFLPTFNIAVECQGAQHYKPIDKFGGENQFIRQTYLDKLKRRICENNNVTLYEVPYWCCDKEIDLLIDRIIKECIHDYSQEFTDYSY